MNTDKREIGRRIKQALDSAKITQRTLAEKLGVVEPTITGYIQGRTEPSGTGFATIAELTGVTTDWLITGKEYGTEISAMVTGEAPDGVGPTDEEMKDIPAAFQEVIREGKKLPLAKQYRFAADALEKIAEYEAEEIKKREREERED